MAQKQLHGKRRYFIVEVGPTLSVKVWKKAKEGIQLTPMKNHTTLGFTITLEQFKQLVNSQDMVLLASDFMRGLVGFSPDDVEDQFDQQMDLDQETEQEMDMQID